MGSARARTRSRRHSGGYAALLFVLASTVIFGMAAFAIDASNWYVTGHRAQRAADAGALGGVVKLPGEPDQAFLSAKDLARINGYDDASDSTTVVAALDGQPTRLRVTVTTTVDNAFGALLGIPETTISRSAVADYAAPAPMGSPCNTFGNDPDNDAKAAPATSDGNRSASCSGASGVLGQYWANINNYGTDKEYGDRFQSFVCKNPNYSKRATDECAGNTNSEYRADGYYYTVTVPAGLPDLTIQVFDPAWINTGLTCEDNFGSGSSAASTARNSFITGTSETTVYAKGVDKPHCTGDGYASYEGGSASAMTTRFEVRSPGLNPWDANSFPVLDTSSCRPTAYAGYTGALKRKLHQTDGQYSSTIASSFRRWSTLCTVPTPPPGDYLVHVQAGGLGTDAAIGTNHFALRAFSAGSTAGKDAISIAGRGTMSMYSNKPGVTTEFHLARVLESSAGQTLNIKLFDVGDDLSGNTGTITLRPPPLSGLTSFDGCIGSGPSAGPLPGCKFTVKFATHNARSQEIAVPIPQDYTCDDSVATDCWVRLQYAYGGGSTPTDITTWEADVFGDPVRLVE